MPCGLSVHGGFRVWCASKKLSVLRLRVLGSSRGLKELEPWALVVFRCLGLLGQADGDPKKYCENRLDLRSEL